MNNETNNKVTIAVVVMIAVIFGVGAYISKAESNNQENERILLENELKFYNGYSSKTINTIKNYNN